MKHTAITIAVLNLFVFGLSPAFAEEAVSDVKHGVSIAQMRGVPVKWDIDANMATFVEQAEAAGAEKPDIFITPECWLDGYAAPHEASTREKLMEVAQPLEGSPYLDKAAELARKHDNHIRDRRPELYKSLSKGTYIPPAE